MRHRAVLSCFLVALLALAGATWILAPAARGDTGGTKVKPPTLLWKSYPLKPKPKGTAQAEQTRARVRRQASGQTAAHETPVSSPMLVMLALVALFGVGGAIVLRLGLVPVEVGQFRRGRAPPTQAPGKEVVETTRRRTRHRRPRHEAVVAGAEEREAQQEPEPPLEVQLQQLIERVERAPQSERAELAEKIELLHELIASGSTQAAARLKAQPRAPERRHVRQTSVARCEIRIWRGFVKCQLFAALDGSEEAFALSRDFRLPDKAEPTARAEEALSELVATLEQDGWTVVSEGPRWYQHRLERPRYAEPG